MDEKRLAEKLRDVLSGKYAHHWTIQIESIINELDPPRPEPGTFVLWKFKSQTKWKNGFALTDYEGVAIIDYEGVTIDPLEAQWKPVHILGPRQVAVDVKPVSEWPAGASSIKLVYETEYVGTRYIRTVIDRQEAKRMEASDAER